MDTKEGLEFTAKYLENLPINNNERNELYIFIAQNADQFLELSERMVDEVKKIKDRYPNNWKEMVAMTMFSTL